MSDLNDQFLKKQRKELEQKQLANAPSKEPSVDEIFTKYGMREITYDEAKSQLLALHLGCLPGKPLIKKLTKDELQTGGGQYIKGRYYALKKWSRTSANSTGRINKP